MRFQEVTVLNVSNASLCSSNQLPSIKEYFEGAYVYGITFYSAGALVLLVVLLLFIDALRHVLHHSSPRFKTYTVYVLAVYPVICLLSYLTILVPRAYLLSDALIQVTLTSSLYQLFCLFVAYCEGEATLAKKVGNTKLSLKIGPLCCWCSMLPAFDVTKSTMRFLKIQVLQLPIVQGLIYLLYLVIWLESQELYEWAYWYLQGFIIVSFLCGTWGLNMTTKLLADGVDEKFLFRKKLIILQLVIPLTQFQTLIKKTLVQYGVLPCNPPLVPMFYGNLIYNAVNMMEMLLLGFCARKLYKRSLPENNDKSIQAGGIISTVFGTIAGINVLLVLFSACGSRRGFKIYSYIGGREAPKIAYKRRNGYFSKSHRSWMILILIFVVVGSVFLYIQTHKISNNTIPKSLRQFAKELHSDKDHIFFQNPSSEPRNFCETIHIGIVCSGFNSNVHLHALLKSLFMTRSNPIHLHILVSNNSAIVLRLLFKSWHIPQVNVSFYNISKWLKDVRWVPNGHYSGNYGLLKLIFHKVIPASVTKKLLILDTDLIIVDDIHMLWKLFDEFDYKQAIGIAENQSPYYLGHLNQPQPWPAIGVGFNSGVMLYDLEKLNAMKWELVWTNLTKKYTLIYGQTDLGDQDILNSVIKQLPDIVYKLPCYWNIQMSSHSSGNSCYSQFKPKILHWNSPQKYAISTRDGDMFRGIAQSVFEFNGNWFRNYPQLCGEDMQIDMNIESADECDKFSKASDTFYRTLLFFLDYNFIADDWDITYVTHLSFDRIYLLENIAKVWTGPISFTLYVSDAELVKAMRLITESEVLNRRSDVAYHAVFQQGEFYPINTLRNVGLKHVKTPYSFLVDVDFTPMKSLFEMLRDNIRNMADLTKKALVVPAFEPVNPDVMLPKSKIQLIDSLNKNEVRPFRAEVWAPGHAPTDYNKWRKEYEPYHVKWQPHYEPYVVVKSNVPRYDERFLGFGWNKVSHIMELEAQNYDFIVLADVFIIHASHALSWDNAKFKQSPLYRRCSQQLKNRFVKELTSKYNKNFSDVIYSDGFMKDRRKRNIQEKIEATTSLYESTDYFLAWGGKEKAEGKKERKKNFPIQSVVKDKPQEVSKIEYYSNYDNDNPYNLTMLKLNKTHLTQMKIGSRKEVDLSFSEEHNYEYDEDDLKFKELHDSTTLQYDSETFPWVRDLLPAEKQVSVNEVINEKLKNSPTDGR